MMLSREWEMDARLLPLRNTFRVVGVSRQDLPEHGGSYVGDFDLTNYAVCVTVMAQHQHTNERDLNERHA